MYSRIWNRFLYDEGISPVKEPFKKLVHQGMILGENGIKMGKRFPEFVVNPSDIVREYGADTLRLYEMFMGAFDASTPWSPNGVKGCKRFLERVWKLQDMIEPGKGYSDELMVDMHQTIKKVSGDYEAMKFNTAIAQMMTLVNAVYAKGSIRKDELDTLLILLNPVAPHMTEEMWELIGGHDKAIAEGAKWPEYDEAKTVRNEVEVAVQICGKIRARMMIPADLTKEDAEAFFMGKEEVQKLIEGKTVKKFVFIPGRMVNIVAV